MIQRFSLLVFCALALASGAEVIVGSGAQVRRLTPMVSIQSLTNAQKLSLPANTPVGTQVSVTDGFVVSGFGDARDGFYFHYDTTGDGARYVKAGFTDTDIEWRVQYGLGDTANQWGFKNPDSGNVIATTTLDTNPWDATWAGGVILTHPALQTLSTPSTAQGGVFVSGGTQDGIYTLNTVSSPQNGKSVFSLLGYTDLGATYYSSIGWTLDLLNDTGFGPSSAGFYITDGGGTLLYYSLSNVATPDLAIFTITLSGSNMVVAGHPDSDTNGTYLPNGLFNGKNRYLKGTGENPEDRDLHWNTGNDWWEIKDAPGNGNQFGISAHDTALPSQATWGTWKNASDDSDASITVTSVTRGELDAGLTFVAPGDSGFTPPVFLRNGNLAGMNNYSGGDGVNIHFNSSLWTTDSTPYTTDNPQLPFPWLNTWLQIGGITPTVTRNNVASEANWHTP